MSLFKDLTNDVGFNKPGLLEYFLRIRITILTPLFNSFSPINFCGEFFSLIIFINCLFTLNKHERRVNHPFDLFITIKLDLEKKDIVLAGVIYSISLLGDSRLI